MLNTIEARALLNHFNGAVPDRDQLIILDALHEKFRMHENLIAVCEASASQPAPNTKEPA